MCVWMEKYVKEIRGTNKTLLSGIEECIATFVLMMKIVLSHEA